MTVQNLSAQPSFITKDGSTIRSILDRTNAPVQNQSLAEARVPAGGRTERHYHIFGITGRATVSAHSSKQGFQNFEVRSLEFRRDQFFLSSGIASESTPLLR